MLFKQKGGMMRTISITIVIGFFLAILNPIKTTAAGVYDGVWIGPETITFGGYSETFYNFTIIYQESANTLDTFDQVAGRINMIKSGNQWSITSPIILNYRGINFFVSTYTITFLNDSHLKGYLNFTAEGAPGDSSIVAYKQSCAVLKNGSSLTGLNGAMDSVKCYEIDFPAKAIDLEVKTTGGIGDCDLYIIYQRPVDEWENYNSENFGNDEQLLIQEPRGGKWYLILIGYEAYSGMSLKISYKQSEKKATPWIPLLLLDD